MEAPQITKLTREEVDSLFDFESKKRGPLTQTLQLLGLIFGNDRAGYEITKAGKERLKRERIMRDREEKDAVTRRQELESARLEEVAKERAARAESARKAALRKQEKADTDTAKLNARKQAEQLQIAAYCSSPLPNSTSTKPTGPQVRLRSPSQGRLAWDT
jgi:DNA-binding PadR family transcriptional regulator